VFLAAATLAASPARSEPTAFKEGEVLIKFEPNASRGDINSVLGALHATRIKHFGRINAEHERISGISVEEAVRRFRGHRAVAYIEPNYLVHTQAVPNDPSFGDLWGLRNTGQIGGIPGADIRAVDAWNTTTGSDIVVAMIDTGVDYTHPDLAPNIYVNPGEIPGNGVDDDHNGFVDDVHGWDFVNHDNEPRDDLGHGTHTAGTVGAVGDNGLGVVGVCWHVKLMPLKFIGGSLFGEIADAISCIEYATMMHARVMSNSWAGGGFSQALFDAIKDANDSGILFVAAAGNSGADTDIAPLYPADYDIPNVISVAATTASDDKASFSNYGLTSVDLGAPGVQILSTAPNNSYRYMSGTSMATPHVAGALALILSRYPTLSVGDAKKFLLRSTDPIPLLRGVVATGGRLNVARALQGPDTIPPAPIADLRALAIASNRIRLDWTATGDDGTIGAASFYDLRYATFAIDDSNFDTAPRFTAVPSPLPYGFPQEVTVGGLLPSTTYYLAIRAQDRFGNTSPVSNMTSATTLIPPKIDVTPTALAASLSSGGSEARTITVRNLTQGTLDFEIEAVAVPSTGVAARGGSAAKLAPVASEPLPVLSWRDYLHATSAAHATASAVPAASSVAASASAASLPVIITDPVQDSALVDLTQVRASSDDTNLNVEMDFNSAIDRQSFGGFLSLDTDQNRATGVPVPFGNGLQVIGADFEIQFFTLSSGVVSVYHTPTRTFIGTFPVTIGSHSLTFRVPLVALGDDEGSMDVAGVVGDITGPTDWFPDSGHGSVAGVRWVKVMPRVGTVPPGGRSIWIRSARVRCGSLRR